MSPLPWQAGVRSAKRGAGRPGGVVPKPRCAVRGVCAAPWHCQECLTWAISCRACGAQVQVERPGTQVLLGRQLGTSIHL